MIVHRFAPGEARLRAELVAAGATLARQGLVRGQEGNLSALLGPGEMLVTPRGRDKGRLSASDLVRAPLGAALPGSASSEAMAHVEAYLANGDVRAIVHAHPPAVLVLASRGRLPQPRLLREGRLLVGEIELIRDLAPGSSELAASCARALRRAPAVVMAAHGAMTVGATIQEALARMEAVELLARVTLGEWPVGR